MLVYPSVRLLFCIIEALASQSKQRKRNHKKEMSNVSLIDAQAKLPELINQVTQSREPLMISGQMSNAVLTSEDYWQAIQETIYLLSVPNLGQSIKEGLSTLVSECSEALDW